jgi:hypothetical protein
VPHIGRHPNWTLELDYPWNDRTLDRQASCPRRPSTLSPSSSPRRSPLSPCTRSARADRSGSALNPLPDSQDVLRCANTRHGCTARLVRRTCTSALVPGTLCIPMTPPPPLRKIDQLWATYGGSAVVRTESVTALLILRQIERGRTGTSRRPTSASCRPSTSSSTSAPRCAPPSCEILVGFTQNMVYWDVPRQRPLPQVGGSCAATAAAAALQTRDRRQNRCYRSQARVARPIAARGAGAAGHASG